MNLNQVTLPAKNIAESAAFYRKMGFLQIVDAPHYARFKSQQGDATFSIHQHDEIGINNTVIYFENEQLDELVASLQGKGFIFEQPPTDMSWLWQEAVLHDPTGNRIILYWAGENRLNPPWRVELAST